MRLQICINYITNFDTGFEYYDFDPTDAGITYLRNI